MNIRFLAPALLVFALTACHSGDRETALRDTNADLVARNITANAQLDTYRAYLGDVERRLTDIRSGQDALVEYLHFAEDAPHRDPILDQLDDLDRLLEDSRFQVSGMREELRLSAGKLQRAQATTASQRAVISARAATIDSLSHALTERVIALELLELHQREMATALRDADKREHLGWYAYGTFDELSQAGVAEKTGGFLGLGKRKVLKTDFDQAYFAPVDIRELGRLPLHATGARLLSFHPDASYRMVQEGDHLVLEIVDSDAFWRTSRYLAVAVN